MPSRRGWVVDDRCPQPCIRERLSPHLAKLVLVELPVEADPGEPAESADLRRGYTRDAAMGRNNASLKPVPETRCFVVGVIVPS